MWSGHSVESYEDNELKNSPDDTIAIFFPAGIGKSNKTLQVAADQMPCALYNVYNGEEGVAVLCPENCRPLLFLEL